MLDLLFLLICRVQINLISSKGSKIQPIRVPFAKTKQPIRSRNIFNASLTALIGTQRGGVQQSSISYHCHLNVFCGMRAPQFVISTISMYSRLYISLYFRINISSFSRLYMMKTWMKIRRVCTPDYLTLWQDSRRV